MKVYFIWIYIYMTGEFIHFVIITGLKEQSLTLVWIRLAQLLLTSMASKNKAAKKGISIFDIEYARLTS